MVVAATGAGLWAFRAVHDDRADGRCLCLRRRPA